MAKSMTNRYIMLLICIVYYIQRKTYFCAYLSCQFNSP